MGTDPGKIETDENGESIVINQKQNLQSGQEQPNVKWKGNSWQEQKFGQKISCQSTQVEYCQLQEDFHWNVVNSLDESFPDSVVADNKQVGNQPEFVGNEEKCQNGSNGIKNPAGSNPKLNNDDGNKDGTEPVKKNPVSGQYCGQKKKEQR